MQHLSLTYKKYYSQYPDFWNVAKTDGPLSVLEKTENELFLRAKNYQLENIRKNIKLLSMTEQSNEYNPVSICLRELYSHAEGKILPVKNFHDLTKELNFFHPRLTNIQEVDSKFVRLKKRMGNDIESIHIHHFFENDNYFYITNIDTYLDPIRKKIKEAKSLLDVKLEHQQVLDEMFFDFNRDYPDNSLNDSMHMSIWLIRDKIAEIKNIIPSMQIFWNITKINTLLEAKENELFGRARDYQFKKIQESIEKLSITGQSNKNNLASKWIGELYSHVQTYLPQTTNFHELKEQLDLFHSRLSRIQELDLKFEKPQNNPENNTEANDISQFFITDTIFNINNIDSYLDFINAKLMKLNLSSMPLI